MDSDVSSSASCRIVVVSSSIDTSREVAHRIKALSGDTSESHPSSELIHWTIKNKYYTAPVHFHPIHLGGLEFIELDDVPAVIYAWKGNEPYRMHMKQVTEQTSSYNPEVSLAISMSPTTDEQLEDFFFEHGFEYVEGHKEVPEKAEGLSGSSSTPGMHRAVDALSTIMWPSMVRTDSKPSRISPLSTPLDINDEVDINYQMLRNATGNDDTSSMQREMETLEKWLEEDDEIPKEISGEDKSDHTSFKSLEWSISSDPWPTTASSTQAGVAGFDDDFTEFVSAPPAAAALRPEPGLEEDSDSDLPCEADIWATSARIFGRTPARSNGTDEYAYLSDSDSHVQPKPVPDLSHTNTVTEANKSETDIDSRAFDLTRIVGTLNDMKEEISRIPDMKERRRAAARAALGFVYGMEDTNGELDAAARVA